MSDEFISFVVPIRDRREQTPGFIYNIKKYFKDFEIIFCCQDDKLLFKKGQLSNLGFKRAKHDIVVFVNLDYRFMSKIDLAMEVRKENRPVVPFGLSSRVVEKSIGTFIVRRKAAPSPNCGGCCVFTKEQFIKSHGNSNLIAGEGPDDNILRYRVGNFRKLSEHVMGHVYHTKTGLYHDGRVKRRNQDLKMTDLSDRNPSKDGLEQTVADEVKCVVIEPNIVEYKFRNIRVPEDFAYMNIFLEIQRLP